MNLPTFVTQGPMRVSAATTGKDFLPRVAALLDVAQISDIIRVDAADTFARPIYAGNAIATVQSSDSVKVITVRGTAFDPVAAMVVYQFQILSIEHLPISMSCQTSSH